MSFATRTFQGLFACLCIAAFSACGGGTTAAIPGAPSNGGTAAFAAQRAIFALHTNSPIDLEADTIVYNFAGYPDAAWPEASLLDLNGTFYGTTASGGKNNAGTLFSLTPGGAEVILHSFGPYTGPDGAYPEGNVIDVGGTLYGTTSSAGANGYGSVYSYVIATGVEKVIYSFKGPNANDGSDPFGGLVNIGGVLYGTTSQGGTYGIGTVYKVTTAGVETDLHTFTGTTDGGEPESGLLNVGGVLYGTTGYGGEDEVGTVFSITTGGTKNVIYTFDNENGDANYPYAALINVGGTLYGTSEGGGLGHGTVFSVTTGGTEKVVYSFAGGAADGAIPTSRLLDVNGTLYGTTSQGGSTDVGDGTVFKVTLAGKEHVVHFFTGATGDGDFPLAGLIEVNKVLYGTTKLGGLDNYGVVFSVKT